MNLLPKQLGRFSPNFEGMFGKVSLKHRLCCICKIYSRGDMGQGCLSKTEAFFLQSG